MGHPLFKAWADGADNLKSDPASHRTEIIDCVPTSEASFFREIYHFRFLAETLVSDLKAGASLGRRQHVRVWSAACFTGEEPYSIAISLLEALRDGPSDAPGIYQPSGWHIEVFASDIDPVALATASEGIYHEDALADVPAETKKRYFLRGRGDMAGRLRVKQGLADLVQFRCVELEEVDWAVEGTFDVIFFRGALSSFHREAQELCLRRMLGYLNPHGYLILGISERVPWLRNAVSPLGNGIHQLRPNGMAKYQGTERRTYPRKRRTPE